MKKLRTLMLALFVASFALMLNCGGGDDGGEEDIASTEDVVAGEDAPVTEDAEIDLLLAYLEGDAGDYINTSAPKVVGAADVMAEGLGAWVILDTRSQDKYGPDADGVWKNEPNGTPDYDDGHIDGAILVPWDTILTYAEANLTKEDKILVTCHTGQLAGHVVLVLNLLGYDAYSLKWGMSSWHANFDLWSPNTGSDYIDQYVTDAAPAKPEAGELPELATGKTTGEEILKARIEEVLAAATPRIITIADVMAAPEDFFIVNYWAEEDYLAMGHIDGSYQYTPLASLNSAADLATLPTDKKIVVYCFSGQHGSQAALFLTLLGYDAWDLKFGTNAMIYDNMTKKQWTGPGEYDFVVSE